MVVVSPKSRPNRPKGRGRAGPRPRSGPLKTKWRSLKTTISRKRLVVEQNGENFCKRCTPRGRVGCGGGVHQVSAQSAYGQGQGGAPAAVQSIENEVNLLCAVGGSTTDCRFQLRFLPPRAHHSLILASWSLRGDG